MMSVCKLFTTTVYTYTHTLKVHTEFAFLTIQPSFFFLSGELVSALACHPEYKLLSMCTIPQMASSSIAYSTFSWPGLLKHLRQMLISNTKMEEGKCTLT